MVKFNYCYWDGVEDLRRAGGGGDPIVIPLGLMLLALCFLALVFHRMKQSNIVACILIGILVGGSGLGGSISRELTAAFIELGIILVLFMGGLEVDVEGFVNRWRLVLLNGLGQISINLILFCLIGIATGLTSEIPDTIFFGLACTLSSTILVLGALKDRQEMETVHGQVILGLMVLQDVVAVVSLLVLSSFDPHKSGDESFGVSIAIMLGKFAATLLILYLLARFVLNAWFKLFAVSGEMLFVGTVGYALGVAGLAGLADFSPEIGGFFAGVSLSAVPYRLEIEHKVEPIKAFGVVLFFFMLGIDLDMDGASLKAALPWSTLLALLTVFVFPAIMWGLGYLSRFRSRTAFMMGLIINQISEFSLILSQLAHKYEVFSHKQFQVITFAMVITLLFSSVGHVRGDEIYEKLKPLLEFLDRRTTEEEDEEEDFVMEDHVVLLGFNETGLEIAEFYRHNNQDVLVVQLDPALHSTFKKGYVQRQQRPLINPLPEELSHASQLSGGSLQFELDGWAFSRSARSMEGAGWSNPSFDRDRPRTSADLARVVSSRRSLDGVRPRRSMEGDGWQSRRSLDLQRRAQSPVATSEQGAGPTGRRSLDAVRSRSSADGNGAGPLWGRRSLDSSRRPGGRSLDLSRRTTSTPAVPMSPVIESNDPKQGVSLSPVIEGIPAGSKLLSLGVSLPGAWLDPTVTCPMEVQLCEPDAIPPLPPMHPAARTSTSQRTAPMDSIEGIKFSKRAAGASGPAPPGPSPSNDFTQNRTLQQSFRDAMLPDRGSKEGMGTNIFSVYADPESPSTWEHYQLSKAKIVVSCMVGGQASEVYLSRMLKKEGVPFLAITNSNIEAKELYDAGCRYVIQQEFLAAKVMKEILDDEIPKGKERAFDDKRREHKGEIHDNHEDDLARQIHAFL